MAEKPISKSHIGFFAALLVVVAVAAGAFWYLNRDQSVAALETAQANPGVGHPPKNDAAKKPGTASAAPTTAPTDNK
jgi:hypothetical protein